MLLSSSGPGPGQIQVWSRSGVGQVQIKTQDDIQDDTLRMTFKSQSHMIVSGVLQGVFKRVFKGDWEGDYKTTKRTL